MKLLLFIILLSSYSFAQNEIVRGEEFRDSLSNLRTLIGDTVDQMIEDSSQAVVEDNVWQSSIRGDGWGLFYWKANYRKAIRLEDNMRILFVGDSYGQPYSLKLRELAQSLYGNGGCGFFSAAAQLSSSTGFPMSLTLTNWTAVTGSTDEYLIDGKTLTNANTTDVIKIYGSPYNEFRIFYKQQAGAGSFTFKVGYSGTYSDTVTTEGSTALNSFYKNYSSTYYTTSDTIYIKAVSGTVTLAGFSLTFKPVSTKLSVISPIEIHTVSVGGTDYAYWIRKNTAAWNTIIDSLKPSLVIVSFLEYDDANFSEDLDSLVTVLQNAKSDMSIMLVSPNDVDDDARLDAQIKDMQSIAKNRGVEFFDFYNKFTDYTTGTSAGVYSDASHIGGLGYYHIAFEFMRLLFIQSNTFSSLYTDNLYLGSVGENIKFLKSGTAWKLSRFNTGVDVGSWEILTNGRQTFKSNDLMNFYIDNDNNQTDRYYGFYKNASDLLFQITETNSLFYDIPTYYDNILTPATAVNRAAIYSKDIGSESFLHSLSESGKESVLYIQSGTGTFVSAGTLAVSFAVAEVDTNYRINITGNIGETFFVTSKTVNGFTANSSNATSTAIIDWTLTR